MTKRWFLALALAAYTAALVRLLVLKDIIVRTPFMRIRIVHRQANSWNLTPFRTIRLYLFDEPNGLISFVNLVGNVVLFIPVGFLVPFVVPNMRGWTALALALGLILAIEGLEAALGVGAFDIDDIILNGFGALLGYGAAQLIRRRRPRVSS